MTDVVDRAFGAGHRNDNAARTNHTVYRPHEIELGRLQGEGYTSETLGNLDVMLMGR